MEKIDFNDRSFLGFGVGEDILLDTCILLSLFSERDPWHNTVLNLFNTHIFPDDKVVLLYTNPLIVNEVLHLSTKGLENYAKHHNIKFKKKDIDDARTFAQDMMTVFIDEGILKVLDGDESSVAKQIQLSAKFGAADAGNVSVANLYGTNFMTIDNKLVKNIEANSSQLPNIEKVYYTTPVHKSY